MVLTVVKGGRTIFMKNIREKCRGGKPKIGKILRPKILSKTIKEYTTKQEISGKQLKKKKKNTDRPML